MQVRVRGCLNFETLSTKLYQFKFCLHTGVRWLILTSLLFFYMKKLFELCLRKALVTFLMIYLNMFSIVCAVVTMQSFFIVFHGGHLMKHISFFPNTNVLFNFFCDCDDNWYCTYIQICRLILTLNHSAPSIKIIHCS